jgi:hypothetical protein
MPGDPLIKYQCIYLSVAFSSSVNAGINGEITVM